MKKRLLAMVTAVLMLTTCFVQLGPVSVSAAEGSTVFSDDFEGGDLAAKGWGKTGAASAVSVYNYGGEYGNVLKYSSEWDRFGINVDSPIESGKVKVSFDFNPSVYTIPDSDYKTFAVSFLKHNMNAEIKPNIDNGDNYWDVLRFSNLNGKMYISPTVAVKNGIFSNSWVEPAETCGYRPELGEWVRVDMVLDIEDGSIAYYFNGVHYCTNKTDELKNTLTQLGAVMFRGINFPAGGVLYIDNMKIDKGDVDFNAAYTKSNQKNNTVDVRFNSTISADAVLTNDTVSLTKMGGSAVTIERVTKVTADTVRIKYQGQLDPGREYKISVSGGVRSVLGDALSGDIMFNADALSVSELSEDFSGQQIVEPFKNDSEAAFVAASFPETSTGDYALRLSRIEGTGVTDDLLHNLFFMVNMSDETKYGDFKRTTGKTTIAFDYISNNENFVNFRYWDSVQGKYVTLLIMYTTNAYTPTNQYICDISSNTSYHIEITVDYENSQYIINFAGNSKTVAFSDVAYDPATEGGMNKFYFSSWAGDTMWYQFDNFKFTHEEDIATVSKVRFVNASDEEVVGDALAAGTKALKLTFNKAMTQETLNSSVTLKNSGGQAVDFSGALSSDGLTYTITPTSALAVDPEYTLTVPAAAGLTNDVTYKFSVGNIALTSIDGFAQTGETALGTALADISTDILPTSLVGHYTDESGDKTISIPVKKWTSEKYNRFTPGTYTVKAELELPIGYAYTGDVTASITVLADTAVESLVQNAVVRKNVSERSPIATGGLSETDSLQMGLETGEMNITLKDFEDCQYSFGGTKGTYAVADSEGGESINGYAKTAGDGEIEIGFADSYGGNHTLSDIKLVFTNVTDYRTPDTEWTKNVDGFTGWDLELLYKNSNGDWVKFYKDTTDFKTYKEEGSVGNAYGENAFTDGIYPTLMLSNLSELTDVQGLKIRALAQDGTEYKLVEADVNMADDGEVIAAKRTEYASKVRFSKVYSDGAIIQRDKPITVTGFGGTANGEIAVSISDGTNVIRSGKAISDGYKWSVTLDGIAGGKTTYTITASADETNKAEISDVLFGDVYLSSGQSNMQFSLENSVNKINKTDTAAADAIKAGTVGDGNVRFFNQQGYRSSIVPLDDIYSGSWKKNTAYDQVKVVSAVAYFFAKDLYEELDSKIPIGVYLTARSGSDIRAWMPEETYTSVCGTLTDFNRSNYNHGSIYSGCWNAKLAPLTTQKIKGVIWYQGEGNSHNYNEYMTWFPAVAKAWRTAFGDETLNFNTVQVAGWDKGTSFPDFRQTQLQLAIKDENVDMASAVDLGETGGDPNDDIHFGYKQPVGERLAKNALVRFYGKSIENCGPMFDKLTKTVDGMEISFTHADGLKAQSRASMYSESFAADSSVKGLEISKNGTDWEATDAAISGSKLKITCDADYKYVRYAWTANAVSASDISGVNLYNGANLPAYPFAASTETVLGTVSVRIADGKATISASVPVSDSLTRDAKLLVAYYNADGTLKDVAIETVRFILNDSSVYTCQVDVNGAAGIKAMVLDDLTSIRPLAVQSAE